MTTEVLSNNVFNKIRSKFGDIQLGDVDGNVTADPKEAVFYDFEYSEDQDTFGRMSISLADGESMKVFYNRNLTDKIDEDSKAEFFSFLKELKDLAVQHQLRFDVRDITKSNLSTQDFKNLADTNQTINTDEMSEELQVITKLAGIKETGAMAAGDIDRISKQKYSDKDVKMAKGVAFDKRYKGGNYTGASKVIDKIKPGLADHPDVADALKRANEQVKEGLTGTARRSYENLEKTRLIIRHKGKVDETIPGARSRQIQSLYIENEDGERFKYPLTHLGGARAMTRHVANGGRPHDDFGQHIIQTSEDIAKLNSFSRYVGHKDQLNDNAADIIEQTKLKLENLRTYVKNLNKQPHYEETFKNFKTTEDRVLDDETRNTYREKFTLKTLDDRVEEALPLIHNIMSEYKTDEPTDKDAKVEPPVDHGAIVQGFLTNPDKQLILRKDDSADKMLSVTKFNNKNTMLGSILSDIAARMLSKDPEDDRVANFASRIADEIEKEGEAFSNPDKDYLKNKKIAIQLARRYIDDYKKMKSDPKYADQVRVDPQSFAPKKDRQGRAKETAEFEQWVDDTINPKAPVEKEFAGEQVTFEDIKPYVSMYKGDDGKTVHDVLDKDGNSTYKTNNPKDAMNYLSKNFSKLRGTAPKVGDFIKKESLKESRTKIVEAIKNKADTGFNIAGIEGDDDRVTGDAGLQIARLKYLSKYQ